MCVLLFKQKTAYELLSSDWRSDVCSSDLYVIEGDAITLAGTQATIRVGDGTAAGAGTSATINAELTGAAGLVKSDLGTLILSGNNSYTDGTTINGGILQIASDANLGKEIGRAKCRERECQ